MGRHLTVSFSYDKREIWYTVRSVRTSKCNQRIAFHFRIKRNGPLEALASSISPTWRRLMVWGWWLVARRCHQLVTIWQSCSSSWRRRGGRRGVAWSWGRWGAVKTTGRIMTRIVPIFLFLLQLYQQKDWYTVYRWFFKLSMNLWPKNQNQKMPQKYFSMPYLAGRISEPQLYAHVSDHTLFQLGCHLVFRLSCPKPPLLLLELPPVRIPKRWQVTSLQQLSVTGR